MCACVFIYVCVYIYHENLFLSKDICIYLIPHDKLIQEKALSKSIYIFKIFDLYFKFAIRRVSSQTPISRDSTGTESANHGSETFKK